MARSDISTYMFYIVTQLYTSWWFGTFLFFHTLGIINQLIIISTDFHSYFFQRGRAQPPRKKHRQALKVGLVMQGWLKEGARNPEVFPLLIDDYSVLMCIILSNILGIVTIQYKLTSIIQ